MLLLAQQCSLVLQAQYSTLFEPQLPSEKVEVIQRMGFGVVNKVLTTR